jgi:hypothetical protein
MTLNFQLGPVRSIGFQFCPEWFSGLDKHGYPIGSNLGGVFFWLRASLEPPPYQFKGLNGVVVDVSFPVLD